MSAELPDLKSPPLSGSVHLTVQYRLLHSASTTLVNIFVLKYDIEYDYFFFSAVLCRAQKRIKSVGMDIA